ncbi:D-tyrosyl-tRNA(Tyr) deacylase [Candidatus Falkowbacteria bacterium RIFOXYB2_FULL_34_18]|uniref:D-aminoacyl-tRNA deacylase n=1 Tax=Candidatus Falkowbacteria bacterium RIFOXYD2_FULL_34_120 TaxID=1798007 RepID=A0A1F5TPN4_9BACT|nr:MAG: D-tyrosyl-tRNA(Tyr) deacylase [Candidatus Falkowbacteria bacterium RIFOXYB2_FULL_34_18]OGF29309.1 MAG: D-tyrosyl-tRNA(Tyr) deacylase [Candidatus Falkowbacteria bacterium RIFOXYC12_FULL_34_55]OGF36425.1 MAG: D-tyrosyl-tRNA(Tyr) deacylase [Candidatus Falkowbacteria bacterium RIFOXYC2_FULL_34_220]OGF38904.1 MAG: D-tyrosyl-tRNA(Tyr) deacylase [Candidatus Falkowbacteria bacterium RIFOXYD12_FULL_34_57]OGF40923.1 MAG: D-tyrosyl-tRNA(Tyr) deacylase [Candidatus Falkowbacteria bacterium RIFOXYD2_
MRAVIQRVIQASVSVDGKAVGKIDHGFMVLFAVHNDDTEEKLEKMANKIINLRIFEDEEGKMNKSLLGAKGALLIVSQFTLYGNSKKGNRPSFIDSASPERAKKMYDSFINILKNKNIHVETGIFGVRMQIELINDGPTTLIIDI